MRCAARRIAARDVAKERRIGINLGDIIIDREDNYICEAVALPNGHCDRSVLPASGRNDRLVPDPPKGVRAGNLLDTEVAEAVRLARRAIEAGKEDDACPRPSGS